MGNAILVALVLMLVAAILGGIIVWLLMRNRIAEARAASTSQSRSIFSEDDSEAQKEELAKMKKAYDDCQAAQVKLRSNSDARIAELQSEINALKAELANAKVEVAAEAEKPAPQGKAAKEAEALERVRQRAKDLDFDRIGVATADDKDDLKIVKGIGPFIEKKLNALGIYKFKQIANFDDELIEKVNEAIEFFPGRVRRDNWVGQAAELAKKKEE